MLKRDKVRLTISPSIIHVMVDKERPQTALEGQGGKGKEFDMAEG